MAANSDSDQSAAPHTIPKAGGSTNAPTPQGVIRKTQPGLRLH